MDYLILKFLNEELTLEEQHNLSKWLEEDPENKEIFEKLKNYWHTKRPNLHAERDEVFKKIKEEINNEKHDIKRSKHVSIGFYLKLVAVFTIIFTTSYIIYNHVEPKPYQQVRYLEKVSLPGQKISVKLPDGSTVKLNADSKLIVPEKFDENLREVELQGEAFFDIVPNPARPFQVRMNNMMVKVTGTSFNVRAYYDESVRTVAVKTGAVYVTGKVINRTVELKQNEMSVLSLHEGKLEKSLIHNEDLVFGWINKKLVFENQSLGEVIKMISKWYGVSITLTKPITSKKFYTANHDNNPSLYEIMESVSFVFDFEFEINNDELVIR